MRPAACILTFSCLLRCASGGLISEPEVGSWIGIQFQPLGQTFTADAPDLVSGGFWLNGYSLAGLTTFRYTLLAGAGTNGPSLATSTVSVPYGFSCLAVADFNPVPLTIGQRYTLLISTPDIHWLVGYVQTDLPGALDYTGGDAVISGLIDPNVDLSFQIQMVPEPGVFSIFGIGCLTAMYFREKMRRVRKLSGGVVPTPARRAHHAGKGRRRSFSSRWQTGSKCWGHMA